MLIDKVKVQTFKSFTKKVNMGKNDEWSRTFSGATEEV